MYAQARDRIVTFFIRPHALRCLNPFTLQNQGEERPSFVGNLVREQERHRLNDEDAAWQAASM